jgi:hypothetical protein
MVDEILRGLRHPLAVEGDHDEFVDAQGSDEVGLGVERGEQLGCRVGRHDGARVRLEGQHRVGAADHLAVAEVHAVELAHGEIARTVGRIGEPGDLHQMVGRATRTAACLRIVDAGRCTPKRDSGRATGRFGGCRSCAARRRQAVVGGVRPAI